MKLKFRATVKDFIIFIIFAIVLFYFVALAVSNLNSFSTNATFTGLSIARALSKDLITSTIVFYLIALVALMALCSSKFYEKDKGFGFGKPKEKDDGYERWATVKEMQNADHIKKVVLSDKNYPAGGVPIMNDGKVAYVDDGENHSLIIGASGSGKTQGIIHPIVKILAKHDESMIISDPKGEVYKESAELLRSRGYKIVLLNFREPSTGQAWNPFTLPYRMFKEGKTDKATELLEDLALNILYDEKSQAEPFWEKSSADYFAALAYGLFEDAKEEEVNINSINMMSTVGEERFNTSNYVKEYFTMKGEISTPYVLAASVINAPAETKGGVLAVFKQKIRVFSSRADLSEMLSHSDFDMRDIGREKTAVFLVIHDEKTTYHALMTTFIKQVYECLIDVAQENGGKLKNRTNFLLDEFANMPPLKDVESMVTAARSRNIRFSFVIQNFSQLSKVYGADIAETIKGNCGNIIFLITTELKALEEISKLCGEVKPKKPKDGEPAQAPRPLVSVADLQRMKMFEYLIKRFRNHPFKTKMTPNFDINWGEAKYPLAEYPPRQSFPVQVFDLKEFVKEKTKEKVQQAMASGEFKPMGSMGGGFAGLQGMGGGFGMPKPAPMTPNAVSNALNVDDLIKKIDAKIAEMEAEEAREAEEAKKQETTKVEKPVVTEKVETREVVHENNSSNYSDVSINPFQGLNKPEEINKEEKVETQTVQIKEEVEEKKEEKPKVNVDVDSIIVNQNVTDDQFFDDFFGED